MYSLQKFTSDARKQNTITQNRTKTYLDVVSNYGTRLQTPTSRYKGPWNNLNASWYVTNDTLHRDLKVPTIKETIKEFCQRYRDRLEVRPNNLAADLMKAGGIVKRARG